MENKTKVYLREGKITKEVLIKNQSMPNISDEIMNKWQRIINIMANILQVPAGLIMQITNDSMVVFLKSQNKDNPYPDGGSDKLGHGLYCETVIGSNNELIVENALNNKEWSDNPDVKLNMISYYGLPIHWPNSEFFGTICVLDNKPKNYSNDYKNLLNEFREAIETDLKTLVYENKLKYYANMDLLTSSYNRNKIERILEKQFYNCKNEDCKFAISIMDINQLKKINDENGHIMGDKIIKTFANSFKSRISEECSFGRWGGDEFVLICPNHDKKTLQKKLEEIFSLITDEMKAVIPYSSYCFGCAENKKEDDDFQNILTRADDDLYKWKRELKKNQYKDF